MPALNWFQNFEMCHNDFNNHFYSSGFPQSKISIQISEAKDFKEQNQKFIEMQIPYLIFLESKKTFLPVVGKDYFYVPKEFGLLCPVHSESRTHQISGKDHNSVQRIQQKDEEMYKIIVEFIKSLI